MQNIKSIAKNMKRMACDPGDPSFTRKDAILYLAPDIESLLDRNWTYEQVSFFLKSQGIDCPRGSLSVYIGLHRKAERSHSTQQGALS